MATSFPTSLQDLDATRGTTGQPLSSPNHITHHTLEDDTSEALQAKVGIDGSVVTTTLDYKLKSTSSVDPGHHHTNTSIDSLALSKLTGAGTGVLTALAINIGSAGAPVTFNGALGTPSSGVMTNVTGLTEAGQTLADVTTLDVSTSKHGYAPKAPNDVTKFLNGLGLYSVPVAGSAKLAVATSVLTLTNSTTETDIIPNTSVVAGSLSSGRAIRFEAYISVQNNNTDDNVVFKLYFGGSSVLSITLPRFNYGATELFGYFSATIAYVGSSSQFNSGFAQTNMPISGVSKSSSIVNSSTSAVNEASTQNVKFTVTPSTANSTTIVKVYGATIHLI